jgi:hypothetical protein
MTVEALIADQASIGTPPEKKVGKIDGAEMGPSQLLFFLASRAD